MSRDEYHLKNQEQKEAAQSVHVGALCRVESFDPVKMTVDAQPLSKALDGGVYRTQPPVLGVPVALIRGGGFVLRPWYSAGDMGILMYIDHDIDRIVESGQECQPNTERNHSDGDAMFIGAFVPKNNTLSKLPLNALVMAAEGGKSYFAVSQDSIEIGGDLTLKGNLTLTGRADISNDVTASNITLSGGMTAGGDVAASGKSLASHTHSGVHGTTSSPL